MASNAAAGLAGAERGRARSDAARVRDVSPRTVSTSTLARRRAEASSRHRALRDARHNDGFNETRIFRHPCGVRFTRSVVTKRGWAAVRGSDGEAPASPFGAASCA
ncbi:hypothetical protein BFR06_14480 [Burkholderia pseudomallei]|nr:hypothetical protein BFR05_14465 [Burkholderia pseudomallei]APF98944.1 hypothetical protein BFR06_14480 [Burkholderia pseudomallei]APY98025.1 hypothetical protein BGI49_02995 [Burkholderia pseudomallei]APZ11608.1 hypothetical protein BGI52_02995 [Burkholderia pseudomallei]OMZ39135.1 hypothetical protein AQ861_30085 [Burkholderia pseudomallei]